ncbi:DUF6786 family protein [Terrimonas pollutisoli]|uniref:DUF6786 family protein n=1 Tax=Terrimonas pollutisoli TaxID=3034147 RepID=UPI0023ED31A3|nr:DUF6786 family protein [Terrimonas sp. H1YJ31]
MAVHCINENFIMDGKRLAFLLVGVSVIFSCHVSETPFQKDLDFLEKYDSVVVLTRGESKVVVSPKYQAKVFTSTTGDGSSFGWINYQAFDAPPDPHMNAYGGENRIWLGPEGGPFSLFFPRGFVMDFGNWKIPAAFDTEPWQLLSASDTAVTIKKDMKLVNYSGTELSLSVNRRIGVLDNSGIKQRLGIQYGTGARTVGYFTENNLANMGEQPWTDSTGMPCIWILDMFPPSPNTTVIIPYNKKDGISKSANTNYFGEIPASRIKYADNTIFFKADGKLRSKLGIPPGSAKNIAGSYDADKKVLTITLFDVSPTGRYLNMEWDTKKPPFSGDAVNAYNDGPLEDGRQLGPFYELESVSPAAFLSPGQSLMHRHSVFHFTGDEKELDAICLETLGVTLSQVKDMFK